MTAQVGVLNQLGVALAADSAVTLGGRKVYASADKLFQLAASSPVGVMVYGNAGIGGLPWETVVKDYREQLRDQSFPTLRQFAQDFVRHLGSRRSPFTARARESETESRVAALLLELRDRLRARLEEIETKQPQLSERDVKFALDAVVREADSIISARPILASISSASASAARRRHAAAFRSLEKEILGDLPFTARALRDLHNLPGKLLRRDAFGPGLSGIVIAGFGDREHWPSIVSMEVDGFVGATPRAADRGEAAISDRSQALVIPFAQKEMVYAFMEGIDPELDDLVKSSTQELFSGLLTALSAEVSTNPSERTAISAGLAKRVRDLLPDLFNAWARYRKERHTDPIMDVVAALPKDELAGMAESLVNLTKFKRRVSNQTETVGGPIDVAVITKGDGFVWIKRKHYFAPELNPRTLARYGRRA